MWIKIPETDVEYQSTINENIEIRLKRNPDFKGVVSNGWSGPNADEIMKHNRKNVMDYLIALQRLTQ